MEFEGNNRLEPEICILNEKEVYALPEGIIENPMFKKAFADFEVCEVKEIETIEQKYFDDKDVEILPTKEIIQISKGFIEQQVIGKGSKTSIQQIEQFEDIEVQKYYIDGVEKSPFELTAKTILIESKRT